MKIPAINKVDREIAVLKNKAEEQEVFVDAPAEELISFMWQLTAEIFSLQGIDAEQRLQKNVTNLIRRPGPKINSMPIICVI